MTRLAAYLHCCIGCKLTFANCDLKDRIPFGKSFSVCEKYLIVMACLLDTVQSHFHCTFTLMNYKIYIFCYSVQIFTPLLDLQKHCKHSWRGTVYQKSKTSMLSFLDLSLWLRLYQLAQTRPHNVLHFLVYGSGQSQQTSSIHTHMHNAVMLV